jgi:MFS family permease
MTLNSPEGRVPKAKPPSLPMPGWLIAVIAVLEGFTTLSVEVIAIRLAVPVVGSSIVLTGITLGAVLLALSAGYWAGGELSSRLPRERIRGKLAHCLGAAAALYAVAFMLHPFLLDVLVPSCGLELGIALASLVYLLPVFLASQTIPLLTQLSTTDLTRAGLGAGKMLFFSTLGSVAGSALTPIVLFQLIGVSASAGLVLGVLVICALVCAFKAATVVTGVTAGLIGLALLPSSSAVAVIDTAYQTIRVYRGDQIRGFDRSLKARYLVVNRTPQSGLDRYGHSAFEYSRHLVQLVLGQKPRLHVLVIGAAGFTIPMDLAAHGVRSIAVDIDPRVRAVAEQWLWQRPLSGLIIFKAQSARLALRVAARTGATRHEVVILDAFSDRSMPAELLTLEAFRDARAAARIVIANMILDRSLTSRLAQNALTTFREATGALYLNVSRSGGSKANVLVSNLELPGFTAWEPHGTVSYDDRHTIESDKIALF